VPDRMRARVNEEEQGAEAAVGADLPSMQATQWQR
jgi:hypothetical protein